MKIKESHRKVAKAVVGLGFSVFTGAAVSAICPPVGIVAGFGWVSAQVVLGSAGGRLADRETDAVLDQIEAVLEK